ncbi:SDR family NAD(P)-dependent oxidoreductase [Streptomyces sp. L7]
MSTPSAWNVHGLPPQNGRTYLVTGSTAGIGYFVAEQLAGTGATVVLGARDAGKAQLAMTAIRAHVPDARLRHLDLDLSSLGSIRTAALTLDQAGDLDGIVLNAGVLAQRQRRQTADGHELVYGTNHLGHFALAAQLYPALARTPEAGSSP